MKQATSKSTSVSKLKANLSRVLADVAKGTEYIVTDHNKPVARLISLRNSVAPTAFDLEAFFRLKPIRLPKGAETSAALIRRLRDEE